MQIYNLGILRKFGAFLNGRYNCKEETNRGERG
jgi:hypothetical protein